MKNNIVIRLEEKSEYRKVENLVRDSFWNVYRPGCLEHYILNQLRNDPAFVPELDFVMECGGVLIGQNVFVKAVIKADDGRDIPVMTMGPICITPTLKRCGYGKMLLDYSIEKAKERNLKAIHLDVMFIDEGFGSLDEHSRNQAVRVLQEMAGGSKMIGIISHVTELKQEIDDQLLVIKDESGSHVRWQIS